ncbi:hypothetical protein FGRMN_3221 [Fusarium graminum]|nr:hypothetical protein FGRMN_3221 [Fusarium graminum]
MAILPTSEYGTTTAATVARDMMRSFPNIHFGLMVGIGGGAPSEKHDIRLGDIVVSTRGNSRGGVFQYDYGKAIQDHSFIATGSLNQPPQFLSTAVSSLEAEYELEGQQFITKIYRALEQLQHLRQKPEMPIREVLASIEVTGNIIKDTVTSMKSDHHVSEIKRWLSPADCSTNINMARERRQQGTGTWLFDSPEFWDWKSGSRQYLWLYGWAGCGKTVLITTIPDHLLSISSNTTLSFFFNFNDPRKQKLENLVRSLAAQLYCSDVKAEKSLDELFVSRNNRQTQPDVASLSTYVSKMIASIEKVSITINALDEYTERKELMHWLENFISNKAQLIVTGRPKAEFKRGIPRLFGEQNCILLNKEAVDTDIYSYVKATLEQRRDFVDKTLSPDILEIIHNKVGSGAGGMFRDIKTALECSPHDLEETYRRIIAGISSEYKRDAVRLLQFIVHTKRPLTVPEAVELTATQPDQTPPIFSVDGRSYRTHDILRYCPGLAATIQVNTLWASKYEELHLAHFSVKEYLLEQAQFDLHSSSIGITKTCLTYLMGIDGDTDVSDQYFPMEEYSSKYWTQYAELTRDSEENVKSIIDFLQDEKSYQKWVSMHRREMMHNPSLESSLYYACLYGLTAIVKELLARGADVKVEGGKHGNALNSALFGGHIEVVKLLLDSGADVNSDRDGSSLSTSLQIASFYGQLEVVQLLLNNGADPNALGGMYGNVLVAASTENFPEGVRLLVEYGADVNVLSSGFGSALSYASRDSNLEIVKLLLENGWILI